ncbi:hypothetical protein BJF86_07755 [Serinicoccus sp. CNJ-927]|nr:hypothetical protein BJF86_07755 [Serinicoccus sp. CNJ-927]
MTVRAVATVMLLGGTPLMATAGPAQEVEQDLEFFYGDFDEDVLLFAGRSAYGRGVLPGDGPRWHPTLVHPARPTVARVGVTTRRARAHGRHGGVEGKVVEQAAHRLP